MIFPAVKAFFWPYRDRTGLKDIFPTMGVFYWQTSRHIPGKWFYRQ
jgi:hypothetical protein